MLRQYYVDVWNVYSANRPNPAPTAVMLTMTRMNGTIKFLMMRSLLIETLFADIAELVDCFDDDRL